MNIAFLTPEYPHALLGTSGGIGTSIFGLSKAISAMGHEVRIVVYGQKQDGYFIENSIHFHTVKNVKVKGLSLILTQKKVERLLNALYASGKIAMVEAPDWTGFTAFVRTRCPLVIRENGSDTYFCHLDGRRVKNRNRFLEQRALKKADALISVSDFTGSLTNTLLQLNRPYTVIPNGIDVTLFKPKPSHQTTLSILYFGTLIRKKGVLELPHIFNLVHGDCSDAELILVGNDSGDIKTGSASTWALMQPLFSTAALQKVQYLGAVAHDKIQERIHEATVCVFPSFAEALPVSWLEAMAMEKAIVASNIGWASEVITDGVEGYLVSPTAHDVYANRILDLLQHPKKRQDFGRAARAKVCAQFDSKRIADKSVALYQSLLKS